jgi:predicted DNA-binding protein with PD1-like motif
MKSALLSGGDQRTFALVFDTGDEVMAGLLGFARQHGLSASHFTAIGALREVTLGYYEWEHKAYRRIPIREQVEVLALVGDIVLDADDPKVHAHAVVGKSDGSAHGGHLFEAWVRPTLEVVLVESPRHLRRRLDPDTGLALIDLDATAAAAPHVRRPRTSAAPRFTRAGARKAG